MTVATVRRNMCGVTSRMPARCNYRRTLFAVSAVPSLLQNSNASGDASRNRVNRLRTASAVNDGIATVRRDFAVFG